MTSEEMTTGSVGASEAERKWAAGRTRWWNSTGGGSWKDSKAPVQRGNIKAGDGGAKFRAEWPELDKENWKWMKDNNIDYMTGNLLPGAVASGSNCGQGTIGGLTRPSGSQAVVGAVVEGGRAVGEEGRGWIRRNKLLILGGAVFTYVLIARLLGDGSSTGA